MVTSTVVIGFYTFKQVLIMNIKKILVAVFALSTTIAFAQEQRIKEESKTIFKPHWFIQAQIGAAHTVGEGEFTDLISPAAALNVGYKFAPAFGARVGVSGWQAKGGWVNPQQTYQYKYLQGNVDIMADLSTLFCGFNPKRVFNGYLFAGAGLNRGFDNDEANALDTRTYEMEYLWQEGKFLVAGSLLGKLPGNGENGRRYSCNCFSRYRTRFQDYSGTAGGSHHSEDESIDSLFSV